MTSNTPIQEIFQLTKMIKNLLLAGAGGGIGAMLRYMVYLFPFNTAIPYATLMINIIGSFTLGIIMGISLKSSGLSQGTIAFLATGLCGGFTTFSAFSAENLSLLQSGKTGLALLYIGLSVVAGLGAVWLGLKLVN